MAEEDPLENLVEGWAGSEGQKPSDGKEAVSPPQCPKHVGFKSECSSYARVIQTPESAHGETLDLESQNLESAGRREEGITVLLVWAPMELCTGHISGANWTKPSSLQSHQLLFLDII